MARILVVDDEEHILSLLSTVLRFGGHDALIASNHSDGFDLLGRENVDLILLDLRIGEFDGREFFRDARAHGFAGPIVIVSAFGALRAARELGADGAIEKPFDPSDLVAEVDRILTERPTRARDEGAQGGVRLSRLLPQPNWG